MKKTFILAMLLSVIFSFNMFAMNNEDFEIKLPNPATEQKNEDRLQDHRWTWLDDQKCVRFRLYENTTKVDLEKRWDIGLISMWSNGNQPKTRNTYSGKWSQSADGIWSFTFDDYTIPVGVTKIDGTLYAFNGFGELQEGYEYYTGYKTGADGLVTADSAEFQAWLATQYVPDCTSN